MTQTEHFTSPLEAPPLTGESLCLACAQAGTCCCRTSPDLTYLSFPLSASEWRRLLPYASLATAAVPAQGRVFDAQDREAEKNARLLARDPAFQAGRRNERSTAENSAFPSGGEESGSAWGGDAVCAAEPNKPDFIASMHVLFPRQKKRVAALFPLQGRHYSLRTRADGSCVFLGKNGCRLPRPSRPWYCLLFPAWMIEDSLTLFTSEHCLICQKARSPAHGAALLRQRPSRIREFHHALCRDWDFALHNNESE